MITVSNKYPWLVEQSANQPNKRAIITTERIISYQELNDECFAAADFLISKGIQKDNHVGILSGHNYNFFVLVNALWFIGAVPVPLNTRNTIDGIQNQLHQADIKFLIADEKLDSKFSQFIFQNKGRVG